MKRVPKGTPPCLAASAGSTPATGRAAAPAAHLPPAALVLLCSGIKAHRVIQTRRKQHPDPTQQCFGFE